MAAKPYRAVADMNCYVDDTFHKAGEEFDTTHEPCAAFHEKGKNPPPPRVVEPAADNEDAASLRAHITDLNKRASARIKELEDKLKGAFRQTDDHKAAIESLEHKLAEAKDHIADLKEQLEKAVKK